MVITLQGKRDTQHFKNWGWKRLETTFASISGDHLGFDLNGPKLVEKPYLPPQDVDCEVLTC